ncbi:sugar ABC transporter permease [Cerasicoccus arenae]|uniref:sugar ABC transporter permease n=1 Tax=Cerasicoccus arenae TaxID=424488 RepID=UPI001904F9A9|nr:sugar ABC transporter permease [Cerasicoccus arenae]
MVGILLIANLIKRWPGIFAAISLHRLFHDRIRYIFQVCFVVPMIVPQMVWLLIWKSFYDPEFGLLNGFLNASGGMQFLNWLDYAMPTLATKLETTIHTVINPLFGSIAGLILLVGLIMVAGLRKDHSSIRWGDRALLSLYYWPTDE